MIKTKYDIGDQVEVDDEDDLQFVGEIVDVFPGVECENIYVVLDEDGDEYEIEERFITLLRD